MYLTKKNKIMKKILLSILLIFIYKLSATGNNSTINYSVIPAELPIGTFTGIDLRNSANVFITQGDVQDVKIETDDITRSKIILETKNDVLIIKSENNFDFKNKKIDIYITMKNLKKIDLAGSGKIIMKSIFKSESMSLQIAGSGDINANIDTKELKILLAGSGSINVKGNTTTSNVKIVGSGDIMGSELKSGSSTISISGSGNSTVDVNGELNVTITGSGNVYYLTAPEKIHSKIIGSGKIEKVKA